MNIDENQFPFRRSSVKTEFLSFGSTSGRLDFEASPQSAQT